MMIPIIVAICFMIIPAYSNDGNDILVHSGVVTKQASNEANKLLEDFRKSASGNTKTAADKSTSFYESQRLGSNQIFSKKKHIKLPFEGKGACGSKNFLSLQKCPSAFLKNAQKEGRVSPQKDVSYQLPQVSQLFVFVSTSMPKESIKALWQQVQKVGGRVILRGLIGGTFKETQKYIQELGIIVDIDPPKFEEFKIKCVPTFVLMDQKTVDQASGHISLLEFLEHVKGKGDLKAAARDMLKELYEGPA